MTSFESIFGEEGAVVRDPSFQLLVLANLLGPMGSGVVSPMLDSLTGPYGASTADIGLMMALFSAPAIVIIPITGLLTDRYGRKPVLVAGLALFATGGTALAFTTDFRVALLLRLLQGAGFAGIVPVVVTSLGDLYTGATETTAQGIRFMTAGFSQTVFPLLSGVLVVVAWQYPFFLYAIGFPIAAVVFLLFEEPSEAGRAGRDSPDVGRQLRSVWALVTRPYVLVMVVARGLPVMVWIGFLTYNSIVVVQLLGGSPAAAGLLVAVGSLSMAVAASQAGRIMGWFERRYGPLVVTNLALFVGFAGMMAAPTLPIAAVSIVVAGLGFGITLSVYRSIITGLAATSLRGSLVSLAEAFGRVTATLTPIVMGAAIAVGTPVLGFDPAVRWTGVGIAVIGGVGGAACMVVVSRLTHPNPATDRAEPVG